MDIETLKHEINKYKITDYYEKPVISIIIPAYNVKDYVGKCLLSIIKQTFKEIEILIIDDGSNDGTKEIIELFRQDKRVKIFTQKNMGVSQARNLGLKNALGKYIGFVDSDDWIDENYYEKLYQTVSKYNADIGITSIIKHKKSYIKYNLHYKKEKLAVSLKDKIKLCEDKSHRIFSVWNRLYKKELIDRYNLTFPPGRIMEDVPFSIRAIYYANSIVSVPHIKYHYIERSSSIINSSDKCGKRKKDHILAYNELIDFAAEHGIKLPERLNYINNYWIFPLFKVYVGKYMKKVLLFGIIPILKYSIKKESE